MSEAIRVEKVQDQGGGWHEMEVDETLYWRQCRQHNNTLSLALAGLPGVSVACQTGLGWQRRESLIRVGWPIWLAQVGYKAAAYNPATPVGVLAHLLKINDQDEVIVNAILGNPNINEALFARILPKYPRYQDYFDEWKKHRGWVITDEDVNVEEVPEYRLRTAIVTADLSQVTEGTLRKLLARNKTLLSDALGGNPTVPVWVMEELAQRGRYVALIHNPNTTSEVLETILTRPPSDRVVMDLAQHPNLSLDRLISLSLYADSSIASVAARRLTQLTQNRQLAVAELAEVGATVNL